MSLKERMEKKALQRAEEFEEEKRMLRETAEKAEYNDKGQIKRSGFRMGQTVNYGEEFEEETMERVFKPAVIFLVCIFLLFILAGVGIFLFARSGQFEPYLFQMLFD